MKELDSSTCYAAGYVLGFAFAELGKPQAQLIIQHKVRPARLAGMYNGIGGKVEPGESHLAAMIREGVEEAGMINVTWRYLKTVELQGDPIHVWYTNVSISFLAHQPSFEEELYWTTVQADGSLTNMLQFAPGVRQLVKEASVKMTSASDRC